MHKILNILPMVNFPVKYLMLHYNWVSLVKTEQHKQPVFLDVWVEALLPYWKHYNSKQHPLPATNSVEGTLWEKKMPEKSLIFPPKLETNG